MGNMLVALAVLAATGCAGSNSGASDDAGLLGFRCDTPKIGQCVVETSAPASFLQADEADCVDAGGTVSTSTSCPAASLAGCCTTYLIATPDPNGSGGFVETRQTCYYTGAFDAAGVKAECEDWSTTPLKP